MRWETAIVPAGKTRTVTRFAFFPKRLDDGYTVFFERYLVDQKLTQIKRKGRPTWVTLRTRTR